MDPYFFVRQAVQNEESLLSLCAGIGMEFYGIESVQVTAVDIAPQYLRRLNETYPQIKTVCEDALTYTKSLPRKSFDIISIIDGIEHMDKKTGLELISHMKRVARHKIILFTPEGHTHDGYLKNEPHNAWDIEGADEHQKHKSGWTKPELEKLGFKLVLAAGSISQHDEPYTALMMEWIP